MTVLAGPSAPGKDAIPGQRKKMRMGKGAGQTQKAGPLTYVIIGLVTLVSVFPLWWTLVAASRTSGELSQTPPPFVPGANLWSNFTQAFDDVNMVKALFNSLVVSGTTAAGTVLFCTMAGFAFAKLRFRGNAWLMGFTIGTMMVPQQLGIIPLYIFVAKLGWGNQLQSVILPTLVTAFGVFFMRQYLLQALPTELLEAGWVDGASTTRIFFSIVVPIARPAMAVLGMITFLAAWNDFFWPIVVLNQDNPTVQVALQGLGQGYVPDRSLIMAGTLIGTLPVLVVFALLGKQIVGGIMQGAVKG